MGELVQPGDFEYLGAFRLPGGEDRPQTFAYGGNAMTFNPAGDPAGAADGFPGSLFVMGHDRIPFGEVPDGNQVAEINIPAPVTSRNMEDLNTAGFLQDFYNVLTSPNAHHWYQDGQIEHVVTNRNTEYYPSDDDHPSAKGSRKATNEFIPLLNIFYNRWASSGTLNLPPATVCRVPSSPATSAPSTSASSRSWPIKSTKWNCEANPAIASGLTVKQHGLSKTWNRILGWFTRRWD
jgi:hypothetical protein